MEMRSKMPGNCCVALWLGVGLGALGTLNAVLSIGNLMLIFLALSVLTCSVWSNFRCGPSFDILGSRKSQENPPPVGY